MKRAKLLAVGVTAGNLVLPLAFGHISTLYKGVHFKYGKVDFGSPPHKFSDQIHEEVSNDVVGAWRPGTTYFITYGMYDYADPDIAEKRRKAAIRAALTFERRGSFERALASWTRALHREYVTRHDISERLLLLRVLRDRPGLKGGRALLAAIPFQEEKVGSLPGPSAVARPLRPFQLYQEALSGTRPLLKSARSLLNLATKFPNSELAEPALIMVPRILLDLDQEKSFTGEDLGLAEIAIHRLLARYPSSRFRLDAIGWRGRIAFLTRRYDVALSCYRRQLYD